ncbi:MAG TPA: monovalent cation/H+ antiporter complex subunit F [Candidatus Angelobacter sp.]|nr:monovalent cation/H+ antiporter complex subunit F [Candidatus Angelobacter sp.]
MDTLGFLDAVVFVSLGVLSLALAFALLRLMRGPTLPDRIVALELVATIFVGMVAVYAIGSRQPVYLDVGIVLALVAFLGAVAFARFLVAGTGR